jgi:hypothetical protein
MPAHCVSTCSRVIVVKNSKKRAGPSLATSTYRFTYALAFPASAPACRQTGTPLARRLGLPVRAARRQAALSRTVRMLKSSKERDGALALGSLHQIGRTLKNFFPLTYQPLMALLHVSSSHKSDQRVRMSRPAS